jgi:hypothetical protein
MDNEFQWRNQMRKLNQPVEPARDLWPDIAARIAQPVAVPQRRQQWRRPAFAVAASVALAIGAVFTASQLPRSGSAPSVAGGTTHGTTTDAAPPTALDWAKPADPKLAAAAQDLDKASADLQAALEARPDAVFLVSMINRTNAQRMRLMRQSAISG